MAQPTHADAAAANRPKPAAGAAERLRQAFAAEERAAIRRATQVIVAAIAAIIALLFVLLPVAEVPFYAAVLIAFAGLFVVRYGLSHSGFARDWHGYVFAVLVYALFTVAAQVPNPLDATPWPVQMQPRYGMFVFSFIFLIPFAFSYSPTLVAWAGAVCCATWSVGMAWLVSRPQSIGAFPGQQPWSPEEGLARFLDPYFVSIDNWIQNVVVMLIVAGTLAAVVRRSRDLVQREVTMERERTNLARYFPPTVVDRLAVADEPLGAVRVQPVAVLFADIVGFTRLAEGTAPGPLVDLLRDFHGRLEAAVFEHGGTLNKFLGDGIMATFGTPDTGAHDASNAIAGARTMLAAINDMNRVRAVGGDPPLRLSVGIHYGEAVLGDIGSARQLEYGVLGDVVNVASRLEALTRQLDCQLIVSDAVVAAARAEPGTRAEALLAGFREPVEEPVRGREERVTVWCLEPRA